MDSIIIDLFKHDCIKFGDFKLKSKVTSPIYIDFKAVISFPHILNFIVDAIIHKIKKINIDRICGVPYGGIVFASYIARDMNLPNVIVRKEMKKYGTKSLVEGTIEKGDNLVLIEDILSTGKSIIEFIGKIQKAKGIDININDIFVICDRRMNFTNSELSKYRIHSLFTIHDIMNVLFYNHCINHSEFTKVYSFLKMSIQEPKRPLSYFHDTGNHIKRRLAEIMITKKTNLCLSCDISNFYDLIDIVGKIGHSICILKIHCDIIDGFNYEKGMLLKKLSREKNFLIFEDRKFNDISSIFMKQYTGGIYKISEWADIISINTKVDGIFHAFSEFNKSTGYNKAIIPIVDMSNETKINSLWSRNSIYSMSVNYTNDVLGVVTQTRSDFMGNDDIFYLTPGVHLDKTEEADQNYRTPQIALNKDRCDIIIVGRGIYQSDTPIKTADLYRYLSWGI
jgi:uridine monophosphate synthetase